MTAVDIGQTLEVTAESLAFGGFAIARHEGLVLFVPFAAPGDRLLVEITEQEKRHVRARIVEILEPSPHRREVRCRHFQDCGGCQFQHVDYATQLQAKADFVRDALVRIGGFEWPDPVTVHHSGEWGYRARTQIKVHQREMGFHRAFSKEVVPVYECPVLAPELEAQIPELREALTRAPRKPRIHQIEGACGSDGPAWTPDLTDTRRELVEHRVQGFTYYVEPEGFFQGNRLLVDTLVGKAVEGLSGAHAFDLYAGVGLFTMPLSQRFDRVTAVEDERRAATLGRVNAKINGCTNVSYFRQTTEQFLAQNKVTPDLVMMDPPRLGARPAIPALLELGAEHLVYVSCDPNTLARDLKTLVEGGYSVASVEAFDMFPQTYHVECVAHLQRGKA